MDSKTQETSPNGNVASSDTLPAPASGRTSRNSDILWGVAGLLYSRRRFIAAVTFTGAVLSVVIALLLPRWYASEARVLPPEGSGIGLGGLLNSFVPGAAGIFGGSAEFTRSLAILDTRRMMEQTVLAFDLVDRYDLSDGETPVYDAIEQLRGNLEFDVELDYSYLTVRAFDQDPVVAAEMANFLVAKLNEEHVRLTSESARQTRMSIGNRLREAETALDSVRAALQEFQEANGIVELESQAQAFMESTASMKAEAAQLEIQYQTLARQYGADNPQVRAARDARDAARREMSRIIGGSDVLLPVSMQELPALTRQYAELMQEQLIQAQILETIYPIYEQALFQERNEAVAAQIIDEAVPPIQPARPARRVIVIAATLTAFLLACMFVLGHAWLRRNAGHLARRLEQAAQTA